MNPFEARRSNNLVAIFHIASTIDEARNYKTDAVTAANREPGVAITFVKLPENYCGGRDRNRKASISIVTEWDVVTSDCGSR
jgi:hypothetical protein